MIRKNPFRDFLIREQRWIIDKSLMDLCLCEFSELDIDIRYEEGIMVMYKNRWIFI